MKSSIDVRGTQGHEKATLCSSNFDKIISTLKFPQISSDARLHSKIKTSQRIGTVEAPHHLREV